MNINASRTWASRCMLECIAGSKSSCLLWIVRTAYHSLLSVCCAILSLQDTPFATVVHEHPKYLQPTVIQQHHLQQQQHTGKQHSLGAGFDEISPFKLCHQRRYPTRDLLSQGFTGQQRDLTLDLFNQAPPAHQQSGSHADQ